VSFRQARDAKARRSGGALRLSFERNEWGFSGEAGDPVEGRGYSVRDGGRALAWSSPRLADAGVVVVKVAGASYRLDDLQDAGFAPGSRIALRAEPENPHDPNAVGVWNEAGTAQAGYVPRELAAAVAARLGEVEALALWEWRSADGRRFGLRILVAPPERLAERPPRLARDEPRADEPPLRAP
jgi:hypothetical protein